VFFFETLVFLHDAVHVAVIDVNHHYLLTLFQSLIFVLKTQFLSKLLLKSGPLVIFIELGSFSIINGSLMGLVMLRLISSNVRIHIECFLMITIYDSSDGIFKIGSSVRFEGSLIEVILVFGVCE
jgi:hypothetical protein